MNTTSSPCLRVLYDRRQAKEPKTYYIYFFLFLGMVLLLGLLLDAGLGVLPSGFDFDPLVFSIVGGIALLVGVMGLFSRKQWKANYPQPDWQEAMQIDAEKIRIQAFTELLLRPRNNTGEIYWSDMAGRVYLKTIQGRTAASGSTTFLVIPLQSQNQFCQATSCRKASFKPEFLPCPTGQVWDSFIEDLRQQTEEERRKTIGELARKMGQV